MCVCPATEFSLHLRIASTADSQFGHFMVQVLYRTTYSQFESVVERCVRDHWYELHQIGSMPRPKSTVLASTKLGDENTSDDVEAELTDQQKKEQEFERRERAIRGANMTLWQGERTIAQLALEEIKFKRRLEETNQRERVRLAELERQRGELAAKSSSESYARGAL
jgi:hypothetical protein